MPPVNGKYNEDGDKRASWYAALWRYALGEQDSTLIKEYGMDDNDRATIEQYKRQIAECQKNGVVPQFGWSWEG